MFHHSVVEIYLVWNLPIFFSSFLFYIPAETFQVGISVFKRYKYFEPRNIDHEEKNVYPSKPGLLDDPRPV